MAARTSQNVPELEYEVLGGFVRIVFRRATVKATEKTTEKDEGVNGPVNGPVSGYVNGDVNGYVNGEVNGYVNGEVNTLTPSQKLVYDTVNNNPGIQTKQIADVLKRSPRTIEKHLAFLAKSCFIEHRDSDKTGGYYVK